MIDRHSAKSLLAVVGTASLLSGCGFGVATGETRNETLSFDLDNSKSARVDIRMGAGELRVNSGTPKLMTGTFAYNVPEWKPVVDYKAGSGELMLSQPGYSSSFGNSVNNWDVTLNGDVPLEVTATSGRGRGESGARTG